MVFANIFADFSHQQSAAGEEIEQVPGVWCLSTDDKIFPNETYSVRITDDDGGDDGSLAGAKWRGE